MFWIEVLAAPTLFILISYSGKVSAMQAAARAPPDPPIIASILAGIGSGIFSDPIDAVKKCVKIVDTIQPDPKMHDLYQNLYKIYGDTQKSLQKINHSLHDFFVEQ